MGSEALTKSQWSIGRWSGNATPCWYFSHASVVITQLKGGIQIDRLVASGSLTWKIFESSSSIRRLVVNACPGFRELTSMPFCAKSCAMSCAEVH